MAYGPSMKVIEFFQRLQRVPSRVLFLLGLMFTVLGKECDQHWAGRQSALVYIVFGAVSFRADNRTSYGAVNVNEEFFDIQDGPPPQVGRSNSTTTEAARCSSARALLATRIRLVSHRGTCRPLRRRHHGIWVALWTRKQVLPS